MGKLVSLTIDDVSVSVPEGTLIVDAAKKIGIDIPVFCYHPKMEPVGMCRMCLVEIGRPAVDRATGKPVLDEQGKPKISFGPKLETACTTPVSEGMVVVGMSDKVKEARKDVLEFLLTSHPLDCPICDKGGECPLQNLTMAHGPAQSRYLYDEKKHFEKHVPLGDLIFLDRERCIQCARCVRFQDEVVDDPVIGFYQRGRSLEIVTYSDPGFDSYFSGNTSDICPVGALTTADFRFGARPWEMKNAASICTHCPVGCNITLNVRREAKAGGKGVIKRVMPRQNETVNEIWICDKGRFAYQFTESDERLTEPMVRKNGELVPVSWDEAFDQAVAALRLKSTGLVTLAGGRLSNEDLFNLAGLTRGQNGKALLYSSMAGGDLVAQIGVGKDTNFSDMGKDTAILVVACDLEEEAPIWWLRVKQAAERGATVIVANPRSTKLDRAAAYKLRYSYGQEVATVEALLTGEFDAAKAFAQAENAVVLYGGEGLGLASSKILAQSCARLLVKTGHTGRPNNGLIAVWSRANEQGAWDNGFRPADDLAAELRKANVVLVAGADPAGDDPVLAGALDEASFVIVQELFLTETARKADVVFPVQAFTEREGTLTSGERRVQRYYPAVLARPQTRPDYAISAELSTRLGKELEGRTAALVFLKLTSRVPGYAGLTYQALAETPEQWPIIGRGDVYYGGTGYDNHQGVGIQLTPTGMSGELHSVPAAAMPHLERGDLLAVPVTRLYDRGQTVLPSKLLHPHLAPQAIWLQPENAAALGLEPGDAVEVTFNGLTVTTTVQVNKDVPDGVAMVVRSVGLPLNAPAAMQIKRLAVSASQAASELQKS